MNRKKKAPTRNYSRLGDIFCALSEMLRPPERISVSQCAEKYRYVNQPGAYVGPWLNSTVNYMVEPMDVFASEEYSGLIFVGPAQSGKTDALILNTLTYTVLIDPMDMTIFCPSTTAGRDFSIRRLDRLHQHTVAVGDMLLPHPDADNKFDKHYANGVLLTISWPSPIETAGKPIGRVVITDRDRMEDDIGGEGEIYDLASKRTTTFGSYAMTVCESSPSRPLVDPKWMPKTAHEAPPCTGIMSLYNRGDRRRRYWQCLGCGEWFEPMFEHLVYQREPGMTNLEAGETAKLKCPMCPHTHDFDDRSYLDAWGVWLKDGQGIDRFGHVFGPQPRTRIASFWMRGVMAGFVTWRDLVSTYLDAMDDFERTNSEEALKKFYNNDNGEPYLSQSASGVRLPEELKARAETLPEREVPEGVRFLVAIVDIQANMFVVGVFGILPGTPFDIVVVDRFEVVKSMRTDDDDERLWVKPHSEIEDWDLLITEVMEKEYPLGDGSARMMGIKHVGCDSGGKKGVTAMAYTFWRRLRELGKHRRFTLLKGDSSPGQPRARVVYPDSQRKDQLAAARGDIPVLMLNSNLLKDELNGRLDCISPGKGMYRTPDWLSDRFYAELCAEYRDPKKGWINPPHTRNEAWDLSYYLIGLCISELIRVERIDWQNPPSWAAPWDQNDFVRLEQQPAAFANQPRGAYDFSDFGKALA